MAMGIRLLDALKLMLLFGAFSAPCNDDLYNIDR